MKLDFFMPVRLITGENCVRNNAALLRELGERCMIVTGRNSAIKSGALDDVKAALSEAGITWTLFDEVQQNPLLEDSYRAGEIARSFQAEFVVGIGGGSPLDSAKAAAVYGANNIDMMEIYKLDWPNRALPVVAVGTTAGTGSEVAPFAVMTTPDGRKNSFACPQTYATLSFGDPRYTYSLPRKFTVSTALDALSHALEAYLSLAANDMTDIYALQAATVIAGGLSRLAELGKGDEIPHDLRDDLYYGSVLAGVALSQCGTCYCHRLGYFLSEEHGVPHGTACAVYLPDFLRAADQNLPEKCARLYQQTGMSLDRLCGLIASLVELEQPVTLTGEEIAVIAKRAAGAKNMRNTAPNGCNEEQAKQILQDLFGE